MKKFLSFIIVLTLTIFSSLSLQAKNDFRFDVENQKVEYRHGMEHRAINGKMFWDGSSSTQYYNVLNTSVATRDDYHLVSISNYKNNGWGMHSLATFIEMYERENPNMEVMAGVNGDFYRINDEGEGINTHVINYDVKIPGSNNSMALVTDNTGKSYFKKTLIQGNELIVYNKYNEIKFREQVDKINQSPNNDNELTVLFDNYLDSIPEGLDSVLIEGQDIKRIRPYNGDPVYASGSGINNIESPQVPSNHFVVISNSFNEIIENGDRVVFQAKLEGYENVMSATSTYASSIIMKDGEVAPNNDLNRHPRTGIGIKENGDVIFIVVDGRDRLTPKDGVKLPELGNLMKLHGAVEAYNYDGGGSSTLMLRNEVEDGTVLERFDILNQLSDNRLRSLSTGFLVVKGDVKSKPVDIRGIESRPRFSSPTNLYIDNDFKLNFDPVEGASYYEVAINDQVFETTKIEIQLKGLHLGSNSITVRAKGTSENSASEFATTINYKVHSDEIRSLLNLMKKRK